VMTGEPKVQKGVISFLEMRSFLISKKIGVEVKGGTSGRGKAKIQSEKKLNAENDKTVALLSAARSFPFSLPVSEEEKINQMVNRRQSPTRKKTSPLPFLHLQSLSDKEEDFLADSRSGSDGYFKTFDRLPIPAGIDPSRSKGIR